MKRILYFIIGLFALIMDGASYITERGRIMVSNYYFLKKLKR